jgi:hypothetical protein
MTKTPKTDALISSLTIDQAKTFAAQSEKTMWIETELLDPRDISRNMGDRVRDALEQILAEQQ